MIGQVLNGNYRLTDLVGSGGYADVYLARDLRSNTIVAVKILHQHFARDPDVAARFEREATLARRLQTPFVARLLDAGQDPGAPPYMVMEYVQGLTLAEILRRHGPFSIPEAAHIVDQLLNALGTAHALGIIHRDIKPQNLMIDGSRRLKVLDFGIARVVGAGSVTASGNLLGTPEYMALEQVEGHIADHRADLYAAGAVLYQMLTGRPPYVRLPDTDLWELIRRVRTELPPPIRQLRPDVPHPSPPSSSGRWRATPPTVSRAPRRCARRWPWPQAPTRRPRAPQRRTRWRRPSPPKTARRRCCPSLRWPGRIRRGRSRRVVRRHLHTRRRRSRGPPRSCRPPRCRGSMRRPPRQPAPAARPRAE